MNLPQYKCTKVVRAGKIRQIKMTENLGAVLVLSVDGSALNTISVQVDSDYFNKHKPLVGGYYVKYEDGYESFSPTPVFEAGYRLLPTKLSLPELEPGLLTLPPADFIELTGIDGVILGLTGAGEVYRFDVTHNVWNKTKVNGR